MSSWERCIDKNSILYELLVYCEWYQENDVTLKKYGQHSPSLWAALSYLSPSRLLKNSQFGFDVKSVTDLPWKFAASHDGIVVAVLQETLLEIRTVKDGYISVVGKASLAADQHPSLRRMAWSPDATALAVARDNGTVILYNLLGSNLASIPSDSGGGESGLLNPVIGLTFLNTKFKTTKWSSELLIVYFNGTVRSYLLSALDSHATEENIRCSLAAHYPRGLSAVVYHPSHHLLLVAGHHCCGKGQSGITAWRILNDHPYLKLSFGSEEAEAGRGSWLRFLPAVSREAPVIVRRMKVSPNGSTLACLNSNGTLSLWQLPGVRLQRQWMLQEQPGYSSTPEKGDSAFWPVDIDWWSDQGVIVVRKCGAVSVCSTSSLENLLGEAPELLSGPPAVAAVRGDREGLLALDCEVHVNYRHRSMEEPIQQQEEESEEDEASILQASIQAALYSVTDIESFQPRKRAAKLVHKAYRLLGLKTITPEQLYLRKIENGAYDDALTLAQTYNLDCDLVYQRQWRTHPVSSDTIHSYLRKVSKLDWVARECIQRVPDSFGAATELLQFGLQVTDADPEDRRTLNLKMVQHRLQILAYLDSLMLYEKIIGTQDKYDSTEFDTLRRLGPLAVAVRYARDERRDAVAALLTYRAPAVLRHWLPILCNLPETLRPSYYRSLLPAARAGAGEVVPWETDELRPKDWAEAPEFKNLAQAPEEDEDILYGEDPSLREFCSDHLTPTLLEKWYRLRAYQIEEGSGLVENAVMLIRLAREKNVPNLDRLYFDLLTLDALVSGVGDDSTHLRTLQDLSHLEQSKLLLGRTNPSSFITDLKSHWLGFVTRCQDKGCHDKLTLLRGLILHYAASSLKLPLLLFLHLKEHKKCPLSVPLPDVMALALDCLYTYPEPDELENCFAILECLPEKADNVVYSEEEEKLHNRIDILEKHLTVCEILGKSNCPRSLNSIQSISEDVEKARELMQQVTNHANVFVATCQSNGDEDSSSTELLDDLLAMQIVFPNVDIQLCYELFAAHKLGSGSREGIQAAEEYLACWSKETWKAIPFARSVELILQAAAAYFERSSAYDDPNIKFAEKCLRLVSEAEPEVQQRLDLIEALQLLGHFHIRPLPLQVRIMSNRWPLVEKCLQSRPDAYKACQLLIQLAHALHLEGADRARREGQVLSMVALYAYEAQDYKYCSDVCCRLISRSFVPAWDIVQRLGRCSAFHSSKQKEFLAFAILHCPRESIEEMIEARIKLREHEEKFRKLCIAIEASTAAL